MDALNGEQQRLAMSLQDAMIFMNIVMVGVGLFVVYFIFKSLGFVVNATRLYRQMVVCPVNYETKYVVTVGMVLILGIVGLTGCTGSVPSPVEFGERYRAAG